MISFLLCLAILIVGYVVYGKIVDNTFGPDDRETPAVRINDGVDYVVMPQWKLFLVQLLNIAGLGPIFGALQGALWGPVVFLWITFGTIFAGGVHDYFSGMMSERNDGASIAEVTGRYLGPVMQNIMRVFSVVLLIMVGTVFAVGPAGLIVTPARRAQRCPPAGQRGSGFCRQGGVPESGRHRSAGALCPAGDRGRAAGKRCPGLPVLRGHGPLGGRPRPDRPPLAEPRRRHGAGFLHSRDGSGNLTALCAYNGIRPAA